MPDQMTPLSCFIVNPATASNVQTQKKRVTAGNRTAVEAAAMIRKLFDKYDQPVPRYTSYPPVPAWYALDARPRTSELRRSSSVLSIYVHLPFCERPCLYCACNVVIDKSHGPAAAYIENLIAEMDLLRDAHARIVTQMHWGGGTPTYLNSKQITHLFNAIVTRFAVPVNAELSIEIDPRVTAIDHLRTLRLLGFNRLSVGIQDFDPAVQATVRRFQTFEETRAIFDTARELGFGSINADLIYGLPKQTPFSFAKTLDQVLELNPDRVAAFSYAHVPTMKRQQRSFEQFMLSPSDKLDLFLLASQRLTSAGYQQIGMDHFARPWDTLVSAQNHGTLHRNFQGYTSHAQADLLGFGMSAISKTGKVFCQNLRQSGEYQQALRSRKLPVFRGYVLSKDDEIRGRVIESLLCANTVVKNAVEKAFGINFDSYFEAELMRLEDFQRDGLISDLTGRTLRATPTGQIFIRRIAQVFDRFQSSAAASRAV